MKCVTTRGMGFYARTVCFDTEYKSPFDSKGNLRRTHLKQMGYVYVDGTISVLPNIKLEKDMKELKPDNNHYEYFQARGLFPDFIQQLFDRKNILRMSDALFEVLLPRDPEDPSTTYFGDIPTSECLYFKARDWQAVKPYLVLKDQDRLPGSIAIYGHPGIGKSAFLNILLILSLRAGYTVRVEKWTSQTHKSGYLLNPQTQTIISCPNPATCQATLAHIVLEHPGTAGIKPTDNKCFKVFVTPPTKVFLRNLDDSIFSAHIPFNVPCPSTIETIMCLAKGKTRDEMRNVVFNLPNSLRNVSRALNSSDPHDYIEKYRKACKSVIRNIVKHNDMATIARAIKDAFDVKNCRNFPQLSIGVPADILPGSLEYEEIIAMVNIIYPRFFAVGYPGYIAKDEQEFAHDLFIGPGDADIGQLLNAEIQLSIFSKLPSMNSLFK